MNILLVRHGETVSNVKKIYAGKSSEGLTKKGEIQTKKVAEKLRSYGVHAVYSSPIQRAIHTAKIISETTGKDFVIEDAFREMDLGPWEGLSEKDVTRLYPKEWELWQHRPAELKLHGRETLKKVLERALRGVKKIQRVVGERTTVVVTHVAVIRLLLLWHAEKNLNFYKTIHVPNTKIFRIRIDT